MTEEQEQEEKLEPLFICGSQITADGDMLPESFTVFSLDTEPNDATAIVMEKILNEIQKMEMTHSVGMVAFRKITTWEQFADLPLDREIKMAALAQAIVDRFLVLLMNHENSIGRLVALPWVPTLWKPED